MKKNYFKKSGFTLIELLAIIVILAIIAVITVPIILNIIEESKKGAATDSAYGYTEALQKYYMLGLVDDKNNALPSGYKLVSALPSDFEVSGDRPTGDSWVQFNKGQVVGYSLKFGDYVITKYGESGVDVTKGDVQYFDDLLVINSSNAYVEAALDFYSTEGNEITSEVIKLVSEMTTDGLTKPEGLSDNGWIHFKYDESKGLMAVNYSLKFDDVVVDYFTINDNYVLNVRDGNEEIAGFKRDDGAIYLRDVEQVYYDPTKGLSGGTCNSTDVGCMHWYLYSVKGDYANMMLDHNISPAGSSDALWASENYYKAGLSANVGGGYGIEEDENSYALLTGISYPNIQSFPDYGNSEGLSMNARGPVMALYYLKTQTSEWKTGVPKVPNSSSTNEYIIPSSENDNKYQINYSGYHARLITYKEAENLGCTIDSNSCPDWMKKSTRGENATLYLTINGYWTSTPVDGRSDYAWCVTRYSRVDKFSVEFANYGVRPVITVLASEVLS